MDIYRCGLTCRLPFFLVARERGEEARQHLALETPLEVSLAERAELLGRTGPVGGKPNPCPQDNAHDLELLPGVTESAGTIPC